ncbi:MAG: pyridoxamine 5'-phosphate oxidase family protein [Acidimicrobiales bacterium]
MGTNRRAEVQMSPSEVDAFLHQERTVTMCSMHPDGTIHAVAMWYAFLEGTLAVETKRKSQKVQNLRRDPRLAFMVEAGDRYEELRGVELVGEARIIEDPAAVWDFGVSMFERYVAPYTEEQRPLVEATMKNRVVVTIVTAKVVSWDHRKLAGGR